MSRDLIGYGNDRPSVHWPHGAKVAVSFVVNYEEGGENCVLDGDAGSEHLLSDIVGCGPIEGQRHVNMESLYEYGSRAGFWRIRRLFMERNLPATVYAVGLALEKHPEAARAMVSAGWEVASHGYRWWDYQDVDEAVEREHIARTVRVHEELLGERPVGMYQGKPNERTRRLVVEEGGFLYDNDAYNDDLPYYVHDYGRPHLVLPYTLDVNDMKFCSFQGFNCGDQFFTYLKDCFDQLYEEGCAGEPKMMTVGLHCRIVGRPARARALARFLDYVKSFGDQAWVAQRRQIAEHWWAKHPPTAGASRL